MRRLFLLLTIASVAVCAQPLVPRPAYNQPIQFSHLTTGNGLLQSHITCILQDRRGLIWFGTRNGLYRYNGYDFQPFLRSINDSTSLPDNFIRSLCQDRQGRIWIGTDKGVCRYRTESNDFLRYGGMTGQVHSIVQHADGNIYCSSGLLYVIDTSRQQLVAVTMPDGQTVIKGTNVLAADRNALLWVGGRQGLHAYRPQGKSRLTEVSLRNAEERLDTDFITALYCDDHDHIWAGKNGRDLISYDQATGAVSHYETGTPMTNNVVRAIDADRQGRIWVGTERGLVIISPDGHTESLSQDYANPFSLSDNAVYSILCDNDDNVWIGTYFGGVNLYSSASARIKYYAPGNQPGQLGGKAVRQMAEDSPQRLWIATEDGGLNLLDRTSDNISRVNISGMSSDNIHSLIIDNHRNLWIGTFMGGLTRYNLDTHEAYTYDRHNSPLAENNIFALCTDRDSDLWIGTTNGLYHYDNASQQIEPIRQQLLDHAFVFHLDSDKDGIVWVGTRYNGLISYDKTTGTTHHYKAGTAQGQLTDDYITTLLVTRSGQLWVGTNNGGLFLKKENASFESMIRSGVLAELCIYGLTESADGSLWITAGKSIYRLDPESRTATMLSGGDDLPTGHFNYTSALCDSQGTLWFGAIDGLVSFRPEQVMSEPTFPPVQFLPLTLDADKECDIDALDCITLSYDEAATIGIAFAAIQPAHTHGIVYEVKMEGLGSEWQYVGTQRKLYYSHLPSGRYVFSVRASSTRGVFSDSNIRSITIIIRPPFYATWWAYTAYALLLGAFLWWLFRHYRRRQHEKRMAYEMRIEKEKLEKLDQMKQAFFTEISHEFKTPLSLIIAPARKLLHEVKSGKSKENIETILKGAGTMQSLLDELVEAGGLRDIHQQLKMVYGNPLALVNDVSSRFQPLADEKGMVYNIEIEDWEAEGSYSPEAVEKIVANLLSNAFKFTPQGGTVELSATLSPHGELCITVSDTGIGMDEETVTHIFEKFYQANADGNKSQGWGVGLAVTKGLVEAHGGMITVESEPGRGSVFTATLQMQPAASALKNADDEKTVVAITGDEVEPQHTDEGLSTVLLVEDNPDMLRFLTSIFEGEFQLFTANDGQQALDQIRAAHLPDIIVSDVMMPRLSGTELCRAVKSDILTAHIPVILLTAKGGTLATREGYELGADAYIEKPFDPAVLLLQVKNTLKTRDNNRRLFNESSTLDISVMANNRYDEKLLRDIRSIVEENIGNSDFCVNDVCMGVGVSRTKLHVKLKSLINMSIGEYIRETRVRKAKELLLAGHTPTDTAYATGFSDPNYFAKCFKKSTGQLPREFVAQQQAKKNEDIGEK